MITLYIKSHNVTGLKYFGKTKQDPFIYKGSGKYWVRHLKKYGNDVSTIIYKQFEIECEELRKCAMDFSIEYDIVNSELWANLKQENGFDGGNDFLLDETKQKISDSRKGFVNAIDKDSGDIICVSKDVFDSSDNLIGVCSGKILTDEHKRKISAKGRKHKEESKNKIGDAHRGKIVSDETKDKLRNREISDTWRENSRQSALNRPKVVCPYCNKEGSINIMKRWHFERCKFYTSKDNNWNHQF